MGRWTSGLVFAVVGAAGSAVVGYLLVTTLSSNRHDLAIEAAMTSAFVFAPLGGVIGAVVGALRARRPQPLSGEGGG